MIRGPRGVFWLALTLSLVLHGGALTLPGWELPDISLTAQATPEHMTAVSAVLLAPRLPPPLISQVQPPPPPPKPAPKAKPKPYSPPVKSMPQAVLEPPVEAVAESLPLPEPGLQTETETEAETKAEAEAEAEAGIESAPVVAAADAAVPSAPTFADYWPRSGRLVFQVTRGKAGLLIGQAEHRWQHDGIYYHLQATTETIGLAALFRPAQVLQVSRGALRTQGLEPHEFRVERDGKPKNRVHFDHAVGSAMLDNGVRVALPAGTQDLLSLFYALSGLPLEETREGGYTLTVATGRKLASYRVTLLGQVALQTPLGDFPTRHLRVLGPAREDMTEIWYGEDSHLPLKIRHHDRKGEIYDQVIMQVELDEQKELNEQSNPPAD
jgi:hypothetical protein